MKAVKKILIGIVALVALAYLGICVALWFYQEKLIFHPHPLAADYVFNYPSKHEEISITSYDGTKLHGLLFKADTSKGLVFYLHGNAGALDTWGDIAPIYNKLGYDIFILDYRGFGKSQGHLHSEEQVYKDIQAAYDVLQQRYSEDSTVIIGYSIGSGLAAELAATNKPKQLILQAPYYSLTDLGEQLYPAITPHFLNRYKFETFKFIQQTKAPVAIFHGTKDNVIYYGSALKLKEHFKAGDTLFTLPGAGHGHLNENEDYQRELQHILR